MRDAGDELADRRHLFRLQQLLLKTPLLGLIVEQEDCGTRLVGRDRRDEKYPITGPNFHAVARGGQKPGHRVRPGRRQQREPRATGQRRDRQFDQLSEHAIRAAHDAVWVDVANGVIERVDRLLPLALTTRQHFDEASVLERDPCLGDDRASEHEGAVIECLAAVTFQGDRTDGSRARIDRYTEPTRWRGTVHRRAQLGGARGHAIGKHERAAPQRQLQQRLVGRRGTRAIVVGDGQPVGIQVEEQDR